MGRIVIAALAVVLVTGCTSTVTKNFRVFADPSDADIKVVSGTDMKERKYHSPAVVTAEVPSDPALASKAILEVQRENYQPKIIALKDIKPGETLNIRLEQIIQNLSKYSLKYKMITPAASNELRFKDGVIAIAFSVGEQSFSMHFDNLTDQDVKILWDRSEYSDVNHHAHRIMPSTILFPNRNDPIPDQIVRARRSVQEDVIPIDHVFLSPRGKEYEIHSLFPLYSDAAAGLKGKSFNLFLPVEVNRAIIPYNFKIDIIDAVKESIKN